MAKLWDDGLVNWTTRVEHDPEGQRNYHEDLDDMLDALEHLSSELDDTIDALESGQLTLEEGSIKLKETQYWSMMAEQDILDMQESQKFLRSPQPLDIITKLRLNKKAVCFDDFEDD